MAIQTQDAVLLKKKDLRETSLILTFFTRDFGKIHGILKGARGAKSRSSVNPLFFSLGQIVYYEKKHSDLFIITQCDTQKIFFNILKDWATVLSAYYILELVDTFTEPQGGADRKTFDALLNSLITMDNKKDPCTITRLFEIKFLTGLGLWPGRDEFELTKGGYSTLSCFEEDTWQSASKIKLTKDIGKEIQGITEKIISDNLDRPLKTTMLLDK